MEESDWATTPTAGPKRRRRNKDENIIIYRKELRHLTGSVKSALLMGQLEYWFSRPKVQNCFYKFLSPCGSHLYKPGDSWTEELGFTEDEFNTAFDKIGVRFSSRKQYKQDIKKREKAKKAFYYSIHNKIQHVTFYYRNGDVIRAAMQRNSKQSRSDF